MNAMEVLTLSLVVFEALSYIDNHKKKHKRKRNAKRNSILYRPKFMRMLFL